GWLFRSPGSRITLSVPAYSMRLCGACLWRNGTRFGPCQTTSLALDRGRDGQMTSLIGLISQPREIAGTGVLSVSRGTGLVFSRLVAGERERCSQYGGAAALVT